MCIFFHLFWQLLEHYIHSVLFLIRYFTRGLNTWSICTKNNWNAPTKQNSPQDYLVRFSRIQTSLKVSKSLEGPILMANKKEGSRYWTTWTARNRMYRFQSNELVDQCDALRTRDTWYHVQSSSNHSFLEGKLHFCFNCSVSDWLGCVPNISALDLAIGWDVHLWLWKIQFFNEISWYHACELKKSCFNTTINNNTSKTEEEPISSWSKDNTNGSVVVGKHLRGISKGCCSNLDKATFSLEGIFFNFDWSLTNSMNFLHFQYNLRFAGRSPYMRWMTDVTAKPTPVSS